MIDSKVFTAEYIEATRIEKKCDPNILERTIFAFGLLEALVKVGAEFTFKGGTSLMLLLEKPYRLSTDIDIVVAPGYDIETYINAASKLYPFIRYEENKRVGTNKIVKQHFRFYYQALKGQDREVSILLDVLFEENHYSKIEKREIKNELIETSGEPIYVSIPSVDSILGDKLTAFAPNTIGVKFEVEKENGDIVDKKTEVVKQFFDIGCLFDVVSSVEDIKNTYNLVSKAEIGYRGLEVTPENCLEDTFYAALSIFSKGRIHPEMYKDLLVGITSLSSFLINVKFNGETAYKQAAKVMLLAASILADKDIETEIPDSGNLAGDYAKINFMKKLDKQSFNIAAYAISLFEER